MRKLTKAEKEVLIETDTEGLCDKVLKDGYMCERIASYKGTRYIYCGWHKKKLIRTPIWKPILSKMY